MPHNFKGFDGIRALAVISVVLTHLGVFNALTENHILSPALMPMIHGGTGVQAFFVLSGFLITTLLINELNKTRTISIKNFILRRVLRIFPFYILFVERWPFIAGFRIAMGYCAALLIESKQLMSRTRILAEHPATLAISAALYTNSLFISSASWFIQNIGTHFLRTIGITFAIVWLYFNQASLLIKVLELRYLKYIGLISYGIYMYQGLFLATGPTREPGAAWPPQPEIGFLLLIIAAHLSYRYFEEPFLHLKVRSYSVNTVAAG